MFKLLLFKGLLNLKSPSHNGLTQTWEDTNDIFSLSILLVQCNISLLCGCWGCRCSLCMKYKCILKALNLFTFLLKLLFLLLASLIILIISLFPHHFPKEPADHSACSVSKYLMFIECIVLILLWRLLYLKLLILLFLLSLFLVQRSFLGLLYRFLLCRSFLSG